MARRKDYIPLRDDDFFNFQGNLVNLVVTNAVAWGVPAPAVTALTARRTAYEPLYHTAQNKTTRNSADVLAHRQMRNLYEKEIRIFVKAYLMFNPLVPDKERRRMSLTVRDLEPTPRGKITTDPIIGLKPTSGGDLEVVCRVDKDQTRPSMHPLADAVKVRYTLMPVGEVPPEGQQTAKKSQVSRKARFTISLGDEQAGQRFYGFFRWVNLSNPANSGPWSPVQTVIVA